MFTGQSAQAFYNPIIGKWLDRDPVEEAGGLNTYGFIRNDLIDVVDFLGLEPCSGPNAPCGPDDPTRWCQAGPPTPPKPGDPFNQYPVPEWFKNPADEGKRCCCTPPAKLVTFSRNDPQPTGGEKGNPRGWTIHLSLDLKIEGCYEDLAVIWWTCIRTARHDAGYFPDCYNTLTCDFTTTAPPYLTHARIRYLSCENGIWKKHELWKALGYTWEHGHWVQNPL